MLQDHVSIPDENKQYGKEMAINRVPNPHMHFFNEIWTYMYEIWTYMYETWTYMYEIWTYMYEIWTYMYDT